MWIEFMNQFNPKISRLIFKLFLYVLICSEIDFLCSKVLNLKVNKSIEIEYYYFFMEEKNKFEMKKKKM